MEFKYLHDNISCNILETPVVDAGILNGILVNILLEDGSIVSAGRWAVHPKPCQEDPTHRFLHGSMCGSFYEECNILEHLSNGKIRVVFFDGLVDEWSYQDVDPEDLIELKKINNQDALFKSIS